MAEIATTIIPEAPVVSDAVSADAKLINVFDTESAAGNTRKLEFLSNNLGKDIVLLLMFEPPKKPGELFVNLFPVCWKVVKLPGSGTNSAIVEYTAQTAFFVPQVNSGNLVAASNAQPCETGQKCTLKINEHQNKYITAAERGTPKFLQCLNGTGSPADVGVGFYNDKGTKVEPALVWKNVANKSTLSVELTPKLLIYAASDFKETEMIKGDVETPLLWEKNLIALKPSTEWNVSLNEGTGEVIITEIESP